MKEAREYINSNGIITNIDYNWKGEKLIFLKGDNDAVKFMEARNAKREAKKAKAEIYAKKSYQKVNEILEAEWLEIRLASDWNWNSTPRYEKYAEMKRRIERNFN